MLYREAVDFGEQLQRYFDALGREHVHVIIFDDFRADTAAAVRDTFRFLQVDDAFQPSLEIVNPAKVARLRVVQRLLSSPPGWLRRGVRSVMPRPTRKRIYRGVSRLNARAQAREPMAPELRARLVVELTPQIEQLETMLGRDLSAWKQP